MTNDWSQIAATGMICVVALIAAPLTGFAALWVLTELFPWWPKPAERVLGDRRGLPSNERR